MLRPRKHPRRIQTLVSNPCPPRHPRSLYNTPCSNTTSIAPVYHPRSWYFWNRPGQRSAHDYLGFGVSPLQKPLILGCTSSMTMTRWRHGWKKPAAADLQRHQARSQSRLRNRILCRDTRVLRRETMSSKQTMSTTPLIYQRRTRRSSHQWEVSTIELRILFTAARSGGIILCRTNPWSISMVCLTR